MNNIHQVGVVIYVDNALDADKRSGIVNHLERCEGVEDARFTPGRDHLLVVEYDSNRLQSQEVLGYVREEYSGAELVGI